MSTASWEWVRTLVRMADASPALRKVWVEVCHESEAKLAVVLAGRSARNGAPSDAAGGRRTDAYAAPAASPNLRFAAAVAAASVRVAVETWAAGDAPAQGPQGPAELAMRNLGALRDFPWEDTGSRPS